MATHLVNINTDEDVTVLWKEFQQPILYIFSNNYYLLI